MIYGIKGVDKYIRNFVHKLDKNKDGKISRLEFVRGATQFPAMLSPAFTMQTVRILLVIFKQSYHISLLGAKGFCRR